MNKNWLVRTNQSITFLPIIITLFIGLIGYEWIRTHLVGSWVLLIALILLGRLLNVVQAIIVSIFTFILVFIYIIFDTQLNNFNMGTKLLQLFIFPIAPLFLSIYYEIMSANLHTDTLLDTYRKNITHKILPIGSYPHTHSQVQQMLEQQLIRSYGEIHIEITNHNLLRDMLQIDDFKALQQEIIDVLEMNDTTPHFDFVDARLSTLRIIMITHSDWQELHQLADDIKKIDLLKTQIHLIKHSAEQSQSEDFL